MMNQQNNAQQNQMQGQPQQQQRQPNDDQVAYMEKLKTLRKYIEPLYRVSLPIVYSRFIQV